MPSTLSADDATLAIRWCGRKNAAGSGTVKCGGGCAVGYDHELVAGMAVV